MPVQNRIQFRRGTAAVGAEQWTNQVLYAGEVGYETDTGRFKIGDGTTAWGSLEYAAVAASDFVAGSGVTLSSGTNGSTLTISSIINAGSGISVSESSGQYTISLSDPVVDASDVNGLNEAIDDRVNDLLVGGSGIQLSYNDNANTLSIAITGVALSGHTHSSSDITDFNTAVSGLLPVKNVSAGSGISVSSLNGDFTVSLSDPTIQVADITDLTASATELNYLDGSIPGTGVAGKAVVLDSSLNIVNLGNVSTTGTLTVGGDLIVNGSTTTVNSTVTTIDDPILTLGGDTAPVSDDNKDRGIEFRYYNGSAKVGFFGYDDSTGKFTFIPDATNTSEVFSGTKGELDANIDWTNVLNKPDPVIAVDITGDVSGSGNLTMTDLGGGTISISTTIGANSVALGTDTTGDYVAAVTVSGVGLSVSGSGENATYNISSNATSSNTASTIVARDSNGDFTATTITASGLTGASAGNPVTISYAVIDGGTP